MIPNLKRKNNNDVVNCIQHSIDIIQNIPIRIYKLMISLTKATNTTEQKIKKPNHYRVNGHEFSTTNETKGPIVRYY